MSGLVGVKTDAWDIVYKGKSAAVDSWPLMESPAPVVLILGSYLLFVLKFGPAFMKDREPYKLKGVLLAYNFVQVVFSAFLVAKYFRYHINSGLIPMGCVNDEQKQTLIASCIWWYLVAKVSELLDTVFFVLRKKGNQVTFLHLYHHSIMMFGTWVFLKFAPTDVVFLGFLNSLVHVIMYSYYGLAALGPNVAKYLWWKKYITKMQLGQFCVMLAYLAAVSTRPSCSLSKGVLYFFLANIIAFIMLFYNFYRKSYNKTKYAKADENRKNSLSVETKLR